jgi:poly(3-hydroxybutyrate) depolymerase
MRPWILTAVVLVLLAGAAVAAVPDLFSSASAAAKTVYVKQGGSNAADCSKASPCLRVAVLPVGVFATSGHKVLRVAPGGFNAGPCTNSQPCERVEVVHADADETAAPTPTPTDTAPPGPDTVGCGQPVVAGRHSRQIAVGGTTRSYIIDVPAGLNPNTPTPVIMTFHGGNWRAADFADSTGLTSQAAALYVYPQGEAFADAWAGWNVDPGGADFPFVGALAADLAARHCVDPARMFAAGRSNGGFFVNSLLCHRPGLFKAAASVAGGGPQGSCTQPRAFLGVHGLADTAVPITTGRYSREYWLAANQYRNAPPVPFTPQCVAHPGTLNPVIWCEHAGGHGWPLWAGPTIRDFFLGQT